MRPLTDRQQQVLDVIQTVVTEQGRPPTRSEIADALGVRSANAVLNHLQALAKKGYIELLPGQHRSIRLSAALFSSAAANPPGAIPLVGQVAAGAPILAEQNIEGHYPCPDLFNRKPDYFLRVRGMSMRDAGIEDGDLLAVHRTPEAQFGQVVVARVDDEVTVKRLAPLDGKSGRAKGFRLLPANPDYAPIEVDPQRQDCAIEGIAVGVIRQVN